LLGSSSLLLLLLMSTTMAELDPKLVLTSFSVLPLLLPLLLLPLLSLLSEAELVLFKIVMAAAAARFFTLATASEASWAGRLAARPP